MPTVAIISEYNPFHNGHKYQIDEIRRELGEETEIIAIMSGSYTQRGEMAVADRSVRAKAAVECGVNLVLELPFPFCASSAEFFAKSGVAIADRIGVVDMLCFGSELGEVSALEAIADGMLSEKFSEAYKELCESDRSVGHARLCELAYKRAFPSSEFSDFLHPNNILAIEYIKAIKVLSSRIKPLTVKRVGAGYDEVDLVSGKLQSATAIRAKIQDDPITAFDYVPKNAKNIYLNAISEGLMPSDQDSVSPAVILSFLLNSPSEDREIHDTAGGLYNRLLNNARAATSISELVRLTETKHYTTARIRRSIWFSLFGVTSSEVRSLPLFSQVLAMDEVGKQILKRIKKSSDFPIITKPSDTDSLSDEAKLQKARSDTASAVFGLALPAKKAAAQVLKFTPFVK